MIRLLIPSYLITYPSPPQCNLILHDKKEVKILKILLKWKDQVVRTLILTNKLLCKVVMNIHKMRLEDKSREFIVEE